MTPPSAETAVARSALPLPKGRPVTGPSGWAPVACVHRRAERLASARPIIELPSAETNGPKVALPESLLHLADHQQFGGPVVEHGGDVGAGAQGIDDDGHSLALHGKRATGQTVFHKDEQGLLLRRA